jgi:hypothetical protein
MTISVATYTYHVRWVPSHHGMARPQVAGGGHALQFWRAAANILNKQSQTAHKGWSSSLGVGSGVETYKYMELKFKVNFRILICM